MGLAGGAASPSVALAAAAAPGLRVTAAPALGPVLGPVLGPATAASARATPVVLLNGDRAVTMPGLGGRPVTTMLPARHGGIVFNLRAGRENLFIPATALPYLGRGLSPSLFDLASLRRAESGGRLPIVVSYAGLRRPDLPGLTVTGSADGHASGYLTASSAPVFYAALVRQFRADHGRASYGSDGLFAGNVTIALPGAMDSRARPSRPRPDFPMHPVTVTGTNLAGKPDTGDEALVVDAADPLNFSDPVEAGNVFYHGQAKFSVPAGTYWAIGDFEKVTSKSTGTSRLVVLPQFRVQGNHTHIHLDERAASSELGAATPRPSKVQAWIFGAVRGGLHGRSLGIVLFGWQGVHLWLSPTTRKPSVGSLHTYETQTLASPRGARGTPYVYNLAIAGPNGVIPDQHVKIAPSSLATVHERFYQDIASTGATETTLEYHKLPEAVAVPLPLRLPGLQTEYVTGTDPHAVAYRVSYAEFGHSLSGGQYSSFLTVRAGEKRTEIWNDYPLHPQPGVQLIHGFPVGRFPMFPSAYRMGDKLELSFNNTAFSDNVPGHSGVGMYGPFSGPHVKLTGSYAVYQNGVEIAHGNPTTLNTTASFPGLPPVKLSHTPSQIRFVLSGARRGKSYRLSPAFQTAWTWRSAPHLGVKLPQAWLCTLSSRFCVVQPLITLNYQVHGMSLRGSTTGGRQVIGLTVGHLQLGGHAAITGATVQFSVDGGQTWQSAAVTRSGAGRFKASFTAPAGADVSLRTSATDAAGGSITETIEDAYRT